MLDKTQSGAFSDFWALGVILYEMACGKTPFLGRTEIVVFDKILRRQMEWPSNLQDETLKNLIDQLL
jgi:3-phosphoinositide dependent protein kinase-1